MSVTGSNSPRDSQVSSASQSSQASAPPKHETPQQTKTQAIKDVASKVLSPFKQSVDSLKGKNSDYEFVGAAAAKKGMEGAKWVASKFKPEAKGKDEGSSQKAEGSQISVGSQAKRVRFADEKNGEEISSVSSKPAEQIEKPPEFPSEYKNKPLPSPPAPAGKGHMEYMEETVSAVGEDDVNSNIYGTETYVNMPSDIKLGDEQYFGDENLDKDAHNLLEQSSQAQNVQNALEAEKKLAAEGGARPASPPASAESTPSASASEAAPAAEKRSLGDIFKSAGTKASNVTKNVFQKMKPASKPQSDSAAPALSRASAPAKVQLAPMSESEKAQVDELKGKGIEGLKTVDRETVNSLSPSQLASFSRAEFGALVPLLRTGTDSANVRAEVLNRLMGDGQPLYAEQFHIKANRSNIEDYVRSDDFIRHAQSVKSYYGAGMSKESAQVLLTEREPVNISMQAGQYNRAGLGEMYNYEVSGFKRLEGEDGANRNNAALYLETFMWANSAAKPFEAAIFSVVAPALDSPSQPNFGLYTGDGEVVDGKTKYSLNTETYTAHMQEVADSIMQAALENVDSAFEGKGIDRVMLSAYGQGAFKAELNEKARGEALNIYVTTLANAIKNNEPAITSAKGGAGLPLVFSGSPSEFNLLREALQNVGSSIEIRSATEGMDPGIRHSVETYTHERDFVVNAWDPHSAVGNGNDLDPSFDGKIGKWTGAALIGAAWSNPQVGNLDTYKPIGKVSEEEI